MEYSEKTYTEIVGVLFALGEKYMSKLPPVLISKLLSKTQGNAIPNIDRDKRIEEQNLSEDTLVFLTMLKIKYWCDTEKDKKELIKLLKINEEKYKAIMDIIYKPENNINRDTIKQKEKKNTEMVIVKKQGFFAKIFNKIKSWFKK